MDIQLLSGHTYTGTVTGTVKGARVFRELTFISAKDQFPEQFIRNGKSPDQDRVMVQHNTFGSAPALFVTGSIREV